MEGIADKSGQPLSITANYLNLKAGITIVLATVYLHDGQKLSDAKQDILYQLHLLKLATGLPMIIYGDFNMLPSELYPSGWLERVQGTIAKCNRGSTLNLIENRHIDYFVISNTIVNLVKDIQPILEVGWSPHIAIELTIVGAPLEIVGPVMCLPKSLPFEIFNANQFLPPSKLNA